MTTDFIDISVLPGLESLWEKSLGEPGICIAVLDGPVDRSHPCFDGANITQLQTLVSHVADRGPASQHGTHVASIIFGQHDSPVRGIAPNCRGLIVPVFTDESAGELAPCSQIDLARAITQAVEGGADVINISGGQLTVSAESDKLLTNAVRLCEDNNVLIVAAAGNDGCNCLHVPAALESVLAVGAMDALGSPIGFSNWGEAYQNQGILAFGENILGAIPGGGTAAKTGTSFATPLLSGIVALLLSIQLQRGEKADPHAIRDIILKSALPCNELKGLDSRLCLVGTLNILGAYALITEGEIIQVSNEIPEEVMFPPSESESPIEQIQPSNAIQDRHIPIPLGASIKAAEARTSMPTAMSMGANPAIVTSSNAKAPSVSPSGAARDCGCGGGGPMQLVYALGELGYDFGTEARRDSIQQAMNLNRPPLKEELLFYFSGEDIEANPFSGDSHPWAAQSVIWTLNLDATPIYAIAPSGPFAAMVYERLREFLADRDVERVSVPGYIGGAVRLMSGQVIPTIIPEIQGMYSWSVDQLLNAVIEQSTPEENREGLRNRIREILDRIYYDYRNLGVTPQERALNYSATNAFQLSIAISQATLNDLVIETIEVVKSPICRPDSDCYDVKLKFFDPDNIQRSRTVKRFTIDVSDVIPVTIGQMRSWSEV
jgi:cyanobactin maturation PatA/PatG family protease